MQELKGASLFYLPTANIRIFFFTNSANTFSCRTIKFSSALRKNSGLAKLQSSGKSAHVYLHILYMRVSVGVCVCVFSCLTEMPRYF